MAGPRGPRYPEPDEDDFGGEPGGDKDLFDIIPERLSQPGDGPLDDEPKKGRSLLLAALLIGVAVAGGAGWYLLTGSTATDGKVSAPTIPADSNPYKVRPADPGGMQVPNQDKLVYDRLDPGAQQAGSGQVEKLLPEPQAPQAPAMQSQAPQPPAVEPRTPARDGAGDGMTAPPPPLPSISGGSSGGPAPAVSRPEAVTGIEKPVPSPATERPETTALPAPQPQGPAAQPAPTSPAPAAQPAPVQAPAQPAAPQTAAAGTGPYTVQLAALRDEASVRKSWQSLQSKHPELLGNLKMVIERADLGDKGVFYRLRATGLPTEDAGRALCDELAKKKVGCLFVGK